MDWDGTCVPLVYPQKPTEWLPGAKEALTELQKKFNVWIYTSRIAPFKWGEPDVALPAEQVEGEVQYIEQMLADAGLKRVKVWRRTYKVPAELYIDDKGVHYDGSWSSVMAQVTERTGVRFRHVSRVQG